jgi:acyl-CoA thioesterase
LTRPALSPIDPQIRHAIQKAVKSEPFAREMGIELVILENGHSVVEMAYEPRTMDNIYARAHGGAIFALIDEAFETAGQTDGTVAVALNVSVTYVKSPAAGTRLRAEAKMISRTKKTASYDIRVVDAENELIATCQALAFRTGKPISFLTPAQR